MKRKGLGGLRAAHPTPKPGFSSGQASLLVNLNPCLCLFLHLAGRKQQPGSREQEPKAAGFPSCSLLPLAWTDLLPDSSSHSLPQGTGNSSARNWCPEEGGVSGRGSLAHPYHHRHGPSPQGPRGSHTPHTPGTPHLVAQAHRKYTYLIPEATGALPVTLGEGGGRRCFFAIHKHLEALGLI